MMSHQDDLENPLVADTIEGLVSVAGDWSDLGDDGFLREMLEGGEYADYKIVRESVIATELGESGLAELRRLAMGP